MSTLSAASPLTFTIAARRFAFHFLEMCAVMCAAGFVLDLAIFSILASLGYDLVATAPALAIVIIAVDAAIAMAVYMYVRGHPLQHNIEMSGSGVAGIVPLTAMLWLGWIPAASLTSWNRLFTFACGPICLLMFVAMVARFEHYGGRIGFAAAATTEAGDYTCSMHPEVRAAGPGKCPVCAMKLVRHAP